MKKINKKIFISSQIYDTEKLTATEIQQAAQTDLDSFVGEDRVKFMLNQLSDRELSLMFFRGVEYHSTSTSNNSILDVDALVICGCGKEGFELPDMWPHAPFYHYYLDVEDFLGH